jgi:hypothetical protein
VTACALCAWAWTTPLGELQAEGAAKTQAPDPKPHPVTQGEPMTQDGPSTQGEPMTTQGEPMTQGEPSERGDPLRAILQSLEGEPDIRQTQAAALRWADLDPSRGASWRSRAQVADWLPRQWEVSVGLDQDQDRRFTTRDDFDGMAALEGSAQTDADAQGMGVQVEVSARWEPRRLIFNDDELAASEESARQWRLRQEVLDEVTRVYFARRRLQVEARLNPPADWSEAARVRLQLQEWGADLDRLTGGWFSSQALVD